MSGSIFCTAFSSSYPHASMPPKKPDKDKDKDKKGFSHRPPGRPPKLLRVRGRAATNQKDHVAPPTSTNNIPAVLRPADGIPVTGTAAQHAQLASQSFGVPLPANDSHAQSGAVFLDNIHTDDTWLRIITLPVHHMPLWFDDLVSPSSPFLMRPDRCVCRPSSMISIITK